MVDNNPAWGLLLQAFLVTGRQRCGNATGEPFLEREKALANGCRRPASFGQFDARSVHLLLGKVVVLADSNQHNHDSKDDSAPWAEHC